jgi:hypothetical protein
MLGFSKYVSVDIQSSRGSDKVNPHFYWDRRAILNVNSCTTAKDPLACLRAVDVNVLQTANTNVNNAAFYGTFLTVPVVDGDFITQRPTLSMLEGKVNGVRL